MSIREYLAAHKDQHLADLFDFLRIPSISTDPDHQADIERAAAFLQQELQHHGFTSDIITTARHPLVYARYHPHPHGPTILIYGHYDVQPPDPLEAWRTPPFEPTLENGAIIARGASDDKGQLYAHIKAATALLASEGTLPINLTFLLEGEEEIGSPNLVPFLEENREQLAADTVIISDCAMVAPDTPTITYGLKGITYLEILVHGAAIDLHSGVFGGGVPNPINGLARMIASLHDDHGRVAVPGFYQDVLDITDLERKTLREVPFDEAALRAEIGLEETPGEDGYTLLERLWARPTLDANGIGGGFQGEGSKTVIPKSAMAKISCRLVPNQTPEDISNKLETHLKNILPAGLRLEITRLHSGMPALTPITSRSVQAAARALTRVYGKNPVFARSGGTIPVVSAFQELLNAEVVLIGFGLENDRIHSPNEKLDLINYFRGIETSVELLKNLGSST